MSIHFHQLAVREIKQQTADCVTITFDVPETLTAAFSFRHGQNITLRKIIDGEEARRSYSICSAPFEGVLTVAVKKVTGGRFSTYVNDHLKKGDLIDVMPPTGKFNTTLHAGNKKKYTAFAAGSGITPIISIIKNTLATEPQSEFTLVFANRNKASIIFFEELEGLKNKYLQRFNLINLLTREKTTAEIFSGRLDVNKMQQLGKLVDYKHQDDFFICGPEEMIFCVKDYLVEMGIDEKKIHFELFNTPGTAVQKAATNTPVASNQLNCLVQIKLDGRTVEFEMGPKSGTVLDEALKQGADLPFACKGGVCCTCKAKLVEGEVTMDVNWGLEQEEIDQGYILTCQSHPLTEKLIVDFDVR